MKKSNDFTFSFESTRPANQIYQTLLDVRRWWSGLYGEDIEGKSEKVNDVFTFNAGNGAHHSVQRLVDLVPEKKIAWEVIESKLTFLNKSDEWNNSRIAFDISPKGNKTEVTFTHQGLVPDIECYTSCSDAWTLYLKNLAKSLQ